MRAVSLALEGRDHDSKHQLIAGHYSNPDVHNGTDRRCGTGHNHHSSLASGYRGTDMALIILIFITAATALNMLRLRASGVVRSAHLGWISEAWLNEHRNAHPW
jgi:hypothetical protein